MLYDAVKRALFLLDPESAHELAVTHMQRIQQIPIALQLISRACRPPAAARRQLFGLTFPSPVGLAAGFDKDATLIAILAALGFGFIEVGTVTLRPQPGNPRPRMFRYPATMAIVNRMGFNNEGAAAVAPRLRRWRETAPEGAPPLFVNIGKNRDVPIEGAAESYAAVYAQLATHADACVLNVSSPNTPSLRDLQRPEHLEAIVRAVRSAGPRKPLLVKIAPDIDDVALGEITALCVRIADGMICTNTTVDRPCGISEIGGLSGAPLREKSNAVLRRVREIAGPRYPLIGTGGIFTAKDVRMKIEAGADLVQLYTGFIYEGPLVARRLARRSVGAAECSRPAGAR